MSKLYNLYQINKLKNPEKLILIKSGVFYLFLDEDAKTINEILGLKLTPLNEKISKCGFPILSLTKYEKMLKANNIEYLITELNSNESKENEIKEKIIEDLMLLDINSLSPISAINLLAKYQEKLNNHFRQD